MSKSPRVAIIGRPNVGKSTLFNRLTGRRSALVSEQPGMTRDRREERAEVLGYEISLIDTAGLEVAAEGSIADRMRAQSETAISLADLVLFVVDARAGVVPADEEFASLVRRSGRPTVLVANKCEGRKALDGVYDAYRLGLGEPVAISAEHAEGIYDLHEAIVDALWPAASEDTANQTDGTYGNGARGPDPSDLASNSASDSASDSASGGETTVADERKLVGGTPEKPIRLAIVGRPNAGKSTLVNALLGEERMLTGPEPGLTRDTIATPFTWKGRASRGGPACEVVFELFDTAGLRRKSRIEQRAERLAAGDSLRAIRFAEIVVLVVDAECPLEHQDLTLASHVVEEGRALVIAVNKWDLVQDKQARLKEIHRLVTDKLAQVPGVPVITVSALAETGLDPLMRAALTIYETWNRRVPTSELNRWLEGAVARHAPPAVSGRRVKIRYVTQPTIRPPTFVAFASQPDALPAAYQRYLVNGLRDAFGLAGVPIRLSFRGGENPFARKR
ncbi:MAG: ribosome biogenesis GTPase Der [Hyphomicrobiaceae bacterium]